MHGENMSWTKRAEIWRRKAPNPMVISAQAKLVSNSKMEEVVNG